MKENFLNNFGVLGYIVIPILAGTITSFIGEFFFQITLKEIRRRYTLFFANVLVVLVLVFIFSNYYVGLLESVFGFIVNWIVAWLFYLFTGKNFVKNLMTKLKNRIYTKAGEI